MSLPSRQSTGLTTATTATTTSNDEAVPDSDPTSTAGLLAERLQAWKHFCGYLEEFISSVERLHREQAKEYEKVLKTISRPLREGQHFDQTVGGVSGFFENMRANTQALINTNLETEKNLKGSVLPVLDRLHKEIKNKAKELQHGVQKGAKEVEKARTNTQKQIEQLGQQTAAFEASGTSNGAGRLSAQDDPYVLQRGVMYRLNHQVQEENTHRNELVSVQANFATFEQHVVQVMQQAMEAFNLFAGGQAERTSALYGDILAAVQRIPPDFEWSSFQARFDDMLVHPDDPPRTVEAIQFPNQDHPATHPVVDGNLERKSRNKLSWGMQSGYYVVTPSRFLHEFRDADNVRRDPVPELSIYLPEALISPPQGDKFAVKGRDRSKGVGSKLAGNAELQFKTHSPAEAEKWYYIIRDVADSGRPQAAPGTASVVSDSTPMSPISPISPSSPSLSRAPSGSLSRAPSGSISSSPAVGLGLASVPEQKHTPITPTLASPISSKEHEAGITKEDKETAAVSASSPSLPVRTASTASLEKI